MKESMLMSVGCWNGPIGQVMITSIDNFNEHLEEREIIRMFFCPQGGQIWSIAKYTSYLCLLPRKVACYFVIWHGTIVWVTHQIWYHHIIDLQILQSSNSSIKISHNQHFPNLLICKNVSMYIRKRIIMI